jgi:hypothetical protein
LLKHKIRLIKVAGILALLHGILGLLPLTFCFWTGVKCWVACLVFIFTCLTSLPSHILHFTFCVKHKDAESKWYRSRRAGDTAAACGGDMAAGHRALP